MKKKLSFLLALLMVLVLVAGCGQNNDNAPSADPDQSVAGESPAAEDKVYKIGFTVNDFNDKWVTYVMDNAELWDEETAEAEVTLGNGRNDTSVQMQIVEDWITQGYDAVCVKPVEVDAAKSMAEKCNAAGIPYVAVQQDIGGGDVTVGPDIFECGKVEMQGVVDALDGKGKVAYLAGEPGVLISTLRRDGSMSVVDENPDIELVAEELGLWQRDKAQNIVENWIQGGIEFDAICAANDEMAIGAILALEAVNKLDGVVIAGIDGTLDALEYMEDGKLTFTMYADPVGLARESLDAALKLAKGETVEDIVLYDTLVAQDEVEVYKAKWQ
ncbi:MAG: substrate-binding domain-containing protein [Christensenellales bacterium]|jgi:ABC-type sugar transport system substrate-binding protein